MYKILNIGLLLLWLGVSTALAQKPKVWIISDGTRETLKFDNKKGHLGDPDDISALAGYLLMSNMFDTRGIVMGSTHHKELKFTPEEKPWFDEHFGGAYAKDLPQLNRNIGGYQEKIPFIESSIKKTGEVYQPDNTYHTLKGYESVQDLLDETEKSDEIINVLCWGTLTEPAILVSHCLANQRQDVLDKIRFISHWTNSSFHVGTMERPDSVHNCFNDANACAYIKLMAKQGIITFYECGSIGQYGIVEGSPRGEEYYNQFRVSELGTLYVEGKYMSWKKTVDDSDCATYWVLLGNWGVSLKDIKPDGTNPPEIEKRNEKLFFDNAANIRNELLRRTKAAK